MEFYDFPETVGNFIIPTDFHSIIFQRGRLKPPTSYSWIYIYIYIRVVPIRFWRFRFDSLYKELNLKELVCDSAICDSRIGSIRSDSVPSGSKFLPKGFLTCVDYIYISVPYLYTYTILQKQINTHTHTYTYKCICSILGLPFFWVEI